MTVPHIVVQAPAAAPVIWEALAAIGTLLAVIVSLALAGKDARIRTRDTRRRQLAAESLSAAHLQALFDLLESAAGNPGVVANAWSDDVYQRVITIGRSMTTLCAEIERHIPGLSDQAVTKLAPVLANCLTIARACISLERHNKQTLLVIADYATRNVHKEASAILDREAELMALVGGHEPGERRLRLPRNPREGEDAVD